MDQDFVELEKMSKLQKILDNELATIELGKILAKKLPHLTSGFIIYLHGNLGAGKTTLVRSVLLGLDYNEKVKSPTYSIVEQYKNIKTFNNIYHFDLYRLGHPEELEFIGIRDYLLENNSVIFIEWPNNGEGFLPAADIIIELNTLSDKVLSLDHREVVIYPLSLAGKEFTDAIAEDILRIGK